MKSRLLLAIFSIFFLTSTISSQTSIDEKYITIQGENIFAKDKTVTLRNESKPSNTDKAVSSQTSSSQVGKTIANFNVSLTGGATYSIPINTPPGIRDISPDVSLHYDSQSSNGIAGWGWSIAGLSSISRISSTIFHDGDTRGVNFSLSDKFALDGNRLIVVAGSYGSGASIYETEVYSNLKIVAHGTSAFGSNYGPAYFVVHYPDGTRSWYGNSSNSSSRLEWSIYKQVDPQGNMIEYGYINDGNLKLINTIRFGHQTGIAPVEIKFNYKDRTRPEESYAQGYSFKRSKIIDNIETKGNGILYRKYLLSHDQTELGYDRVISIQEFNKNNEGLTPISFTYQPSTGNPDPDKYSFTLDPLYNPEEEDLITGEITGDGKLDVITFSRSGNAYGNKTSFTVYDELYDDSASTQIGTTFHPPHFKEIFTSSTVDGNGVNKAQQSITVVQKIRNVSSQSNEMVFITYDKNGSNLNFRDLKDWIPPHYYTINAGNVEYHQKPSKNIAGDFNGDGLTDVLSIGVPYYYRHCTDCNATLDDNKAVHFIDLNKNLTLNFVNQAGELLQKLDNDNLILTGDYNGDGKSDIFHFKDGKVIIYGIDENNNLVILRQENDSTIHIDRPILLGDYNGDGKTDFAVPTSNNTNTWKFFISRGSDFLEYNQTIPSFYYNEDIADDWVYYPGSNVYKNGLVEYKYIVQDINGDGKSDLINHIIISSLDGSHDYSESAIRYFTNNRDSNDSSPTFDLVSNTVQINNGMTKYGAPLFLNSHKKFDNIQYAYLSSNVVFAYDYEGTHRAETRLDRIDNNGLTHIIEYDNLSTESGDSEIYEEDYGQDYPFLNINLASSMKLVKRVREIGGGINRYQDFRYKGAVSHATGLGFLGFGKVMRSNLYGTTNARIWNISEQDPLKRGSQFRSTTAISPESYLTDYISQTLTSYQTELTSSYIYINIPNQIMQKDGLTDITYTTNYTYDQYNNPLTIQKNYPGGSEIVTKEYINNLSFTGLHTIGRLSRQLTTTTLYGDSRTSEEEYFYAANLNNEYRIKGNGTPWLTETFHHDQYGNVTQKTKSGSDINRTENFEFDSSGRYMINSKDNQNLETLYTYNFSSGTPLTITNPYGLEHTYIYDDWNRVIQETNYLGKSTFTTYANDSTFGFAGMLKTINYDQGQDEKTYYNALGWIMKSGQLSLNEKWIYKSFEYDTAGKKTKESEPYFGNQSPSQWNITAYDLYSRPVSQQLYTGQLISTNYSGLTATVDDGTQTVSSTKDAIGNIVSITDDGGTIDYTYYANNVMKTTNYNGHQITVGIDGWGRKSSLNDPSVGTFTYQYNIVDELLEETTPKGTTTYVYDDYGKLISKEIVGDNTDITTTFIYDATSKLLDRMDAIDATSGREYVYRYYYNSNKKIDKVTEDTEAAIFEKTIEYDEYGRIDNERYKTTSQLSGVLSDVRIKNSYDPSGILETIKDYSTNNSLWHINSEDARGNALKITLGNNIKKYKSYDTYGFVRSIFHAENPFDQSTHALKMSYDFNAQRGILNSRENDLLSNWEENFEYDSLDRLKRVNGPRPRNQVYDLRGQITTNSVVGNYMYDASNPYTLESIDLNIQGDIFYQQNPLQQISYNAFKKPIEIYQENHGRVTFEYGPFMNRTSAYYGGLDVDAEQRRFNKQYSSIIPVEIIHDNTTTDTKIITYLGGDAYSAPIAKIKTSFDNPINDYFYLHRDYLGSILAITDQNAQVIEQRQFGAWGTVDKFSNNQNQNSFNNFALITRGYTGHEHFFDVDLIHMNGRMYDTNLGRFLSADNYIQDPYNTQNYNRHGYVLNNPLSFTDPTGEVVWTAVLVGVIVGAVSGAAGYIGGAIQSGNWNWGGFGMAILGGAIVGGITYGVAPNLVWSTGSILSIASAGFASAFLPKFDVPIGDWNVSFSPSIAFGNASGIGANIGVSYTDGNWSFSGGFGYMQYGNYNGFGNGTEIRYSILAAYDDGNTGFSLGTNWWRGTLGGSNDNFHQRTGIIGFNKGDFRLRYENDGGVGIKHLGLGDRGDSYRTASLQLSAGDFSTGFQLFTGRRTERDQKENEGKTLVMGRNLETKFKNPTFSPQLIGEFGRKFKHGWVAEQGTPYRLGALSFGYKGLRIGVNSEHVRHAIQNRFIHNLIGDRGFRNTSWNWRGYAQYNTQNTFTSW